MIPNPHEHAKALFADHGCAAVNYAQIGVDCARVDDLQYRKDLLDEVQRLVRRSAVAEAQP